MGGHFSAISMVVVVTTNSNNSLSGSSSFSSLVYVSFLLPVGLASNFNCFLSNLIQADGTGLVGWLDERTDYVYVATLSLQSFGNSRPQLGC